MSRSATFLFAFAALLASSTCTDNLFKNSDKSGFKKFLNKDCGSSYTLTCLKLDIVSWVDKLNEEDDYNILPGFSLVREEAKGTRANTVAELARDFPNDPDARLDEFLVKKVTGYLNTHSVKLNLFDTNSEVSARKGGGGGGGGGGKKGGGMGMLMAAGAMMKGTIMALALGGLALLSGKAVMTSMISLMLSAIIGLKSLTGGGGKSTTYEVIAKPYYTHANTHSVSHEEHGGGHSSYGRSFDVSLPIGLQSGYKPAAQ